MQVAYFKVREQCDLRDFGDRSSEYNIQLACRAACVVRRGLDTRLEPTKAALASIRARICEQYNHDEDQDSWLLKNLVDFQFLTAPNRLTPFWRFFRRAAAFAPDF